MRRTLLVVTILQERRGAVNEHLHGQLEGHGRGQVGQAWVHRIIIVSHLHSISGRAHGLRQAHALHALVPPTPSDELSADSARGFCFPATAPI